MIEDVTHIRPLLYTASGFSMNGKEERRPPMVQIQRKYNFMPGTTISSGQVNEEFTNLVNAHNDNDTIVQNVNEYMFSKIMSEEKQILFRSVVGKRCRNKLYGVQLFPKFHLLR